jgi:hypothetical protein
VGDGPPVQQDVVKAPRQHVLVRGEAEQRQAHGRRLAQVKAARSVPRQPAFQPRLPLRRLHASPVVALQLQRDGGEHLLQRLGEVRPQKAGAQDLVPLHGARPRPLQPLGVHRLAQPADHLLHVHASGGGQQRLDEHPVLQRRERVAVLDGRARAGVRRRAPACESGLRTVHRGRRV